MAQMSVTQGGTNSGGWTFVLLRQGWRCVPLPCHLGDKRDLSDGFRWAQAPTPLPIPLQTTDHYRGECNVKMQLSHQYPSCYPLPVAPGSAPLKRET